MKIYAQGNFGQEGHLFGYITSVKVVKSKSEADKIECGILIDRYSKGVIAMHAKTYGDQSSMFMNPLQTYNEKNVLPHFKDFPNLTSSYKTIPNTLTLADNTNRDQVRNDYQVKKAVLGNNVTDSFCDWTTIGGKRVLRMGVYRANATQQPYSIGIVIKGLKKGAYTTSSINPTIKNKIRFRMRCLNGSNNGDGRTYGTFNSTAKIQFSGENNINSGAVRYNHSSTYLEANIDKSLNFYSADTLIFRVASRYQQNSPTPTTGWVGCELEFLDIIEEPEKYEVRECDNSLKNWWLTFPKQLVFMTNYMRDYFNEWYWQVAPPKDNAYHKIGYIPADQGTINIGLPTSDKNNLNAEPKKPEDNNFEVNRVSNFDRIASSFKNGKKYFSSFIEGWSDKDLTTKGIKIEDYTFDCDTDIPTFGDFYEGTFNKLSTANSFNWDSSTRTLSVDATTVTAINPSVSYNPKQVVAVCSLPSALKAKETALTKVRVSGNLETFVKRLVETSDFTVNDDGLFPNQSSSKLSVGRIASAFGKSNVVEIKNLQKCTPQIGLSVSAYKTSTSGKIEFTYYVPTGHPLVGNYFHIGTQRTAQGEEISYSGTGVQIVGGAWTTATLTYGKLYGELIDKPNNITRFITVLDQYKADGVPVTVSSEANDVWYLSEYKLYTDNTIEIIPAQSSSGGGRWTPTNGTTVIDRLGSFSKEFYLPNNGNYLKDITFKIQEGENIVISNLRVQIVEAPIYLIIGQGFADNSGTTTNPVYPKSMGLQSRMKRHIHDPDTSLSYDSNGYIIDSDDKMTDARHLGET
jgi:hypothetical protein